MEIICRYSHDFERFLGEAVDYVLHAYAKDLDLSNLREIELVDKLDHETDGMTRNGGTQIYLTSRLYRTLPSLSIPNILDNPDFKMLCNTIYHEMGHAHDWLKMPNLYSIAEKQKDTKESISCLFWLEYVAEKRSESIGLVDHRQFCEDFSQRRWRAFRANSSGDESEYNFFYLQKALSYFMARTLDSSLRTRCLAMMKNRLLCSLVLELDGQLKSIERNMPFDDVTQIENIYVVLNRYWNKFRREFSP